MDDLMEAVKLLNLSVRFILELCALASLGYWGFRSGNGWIAKAALGLGIPILTAVIWGLFVAPNAAMEAIEPIRLMIELIVFGLAVAALYYAGQSKLSAVFLAVFLLNRILMFVWKQ